METKDALKGYTSNLPQPADPSAHTLPPGVAALSWDVRLDCQKFKMRSTKPGKDSPISIILAHFLKVKALKWHQSLLQVSLILCPFF